MSTKQITIFNTNYFLTAIVVRRKKLEFRFKRTFQLLFIVFIEIWTNTLLPGTHVNSWSNSLHTTTRSANQFKTQNIWNENIIKFEKLQAVKIKKFHSLECVKNFWFLQFTGSRHWYVILHKSNDLENNFDCVEATVASPKRNRSLVTTNLYNVRWVHNIKFYLQQFTAINPENAKHVVTVHRVYGR
jgi:hypothetical protein